MTQPHRTFWRWAFFLFVACLPAVAQQNVQFLPEVDAYLKLNPMFRVYVEAKDDQDGGDSAQAGVGPSVQLYLKPLATLKKMRAFDLDDAKSRFLVLETGYRYIGEPDTPNTNRLQLSHESRFQPVRPQPRRPRLEKRQLHLALSQQTDSRVDGHHTLLPPYSLRRRRTFLREPVQQMEYHRPLCRQPFPHWQARRTQSLLLLRPLDYVTKLVSGLLAGKLPLEGNPVAIHATVPSPSLLAQASDVSDSAFA
jgi:hypothetical protein